ncbi:MAG TPA: hypothetical protein VFI22_00920, partial [Thermomicrobiales bacterium]|nr:hypothetical protein [Thermomicrobiales bacterium]
DLTTCLISTAEARPSGLFIVTGLDPTNRVLHDRQTEIEAAFRQDDDDYRSSLAVYLATLRCTPLRDAIAALAARAARTAR